MRRRLARGAFAVFVAAGLATGAAHAQLVSKSTLEKARQEIGRLDDAWRDNRDALTFRDLNAASPAIWSSGDKITILRLQSLWISMALRDGDVQREIGGRLLALLLQHIVDGAVHEDTAWAFLGLGQAYLKNPAELREGAHYALANAIAIAEALDREGKSDANVVQIKARAYALMGQSLLQDDKPGAAIYYLQNAALLAQAARFSQANREGVERLMSAAQARLEEMPRPDDNVACVPADIAREALVGECVRQAERLWSSGGAGAVETLLARLTSDVRCGSVRQEEMEVMRNLHFARLALHGPGSDALSFTVCGIAGRLNGEGTAAWAAVVAWPLIHAHIQRDAYEQRIADVTAHTARRLMRSSNDALAWLALEAAMAYNHSAPNATDNPGELVKRRRALIRPAIAFDMAYLADRNDWQELRDAYERVGVNAAARSDPAAIEQVLDALSDFFDEGYGFKVPSPVAAMELFARIARKLPADNAHHKQTVVIWPRLEQLYRSDDARAAKVAAENLALYRALPGADQATVSMLLQAYADVTADTEPDKSLASRREALEILGGLPQREAMRIDLLFEIERDRRKLGDTTGAATYFDEAVAIRRATADLDVRTGVRVDMRLAVRMFNNGERAKARALAEQAFEALLAATTKPGDGWARATPAKTLAEILAADGDLARARSIFEEHVLPFTDKAVAAGDATPIDTRLDLATLEALYGPTQATVKTIRDLMAVARQRVANARDIQERGWRSLAIASLGLGDGPAALDAARRAFAMKPTITAQAQDESADRRLSETFVSAAWSATEQGGAPPK